MARHVNTMVLLAAFATGAFSVMLFFLLIGYYIGITPIWLVQAGASVWDFMCLSYLFFQALPMAVCVHMDAREFKVDRYTSVIPVLIILAAVAIYLFEVQAPIGVWRMIIDTALTSALEWMFVVVMIQLRSEWRAAHP